MTWQARASCCPDCTRPRQSAQHVSSISCCWTTYTKRFARSLRIAAYMHILVFPRIMSRRRPVM